MKDRARWLVSLALALVMTSSIVLASDYSPEGERGVPVVSAAPTVNLLSNPSFEGGFSTYIPPGGHPDCPSGQCQSVQIADDWSPWWLPSDPANDIGNPEYKPAAPYKPNPYPYRVHSGDNAQQYFTFARLHTAGIYQRVSANPGQQYRFKIWGHSWSAENQIGDPPISTATLEQRIGIDPTGGTNWESNNIVWGPMHQQYDKYGVFYACATAVSDHITVFTFSRPVHAVLHNDVYWDTAELEPYNDFCQLGIQTSPSSMSFLADVNVPGEISNLAIIKLPDEPGITWHAEIEPGGTMTAMLSPDSGSPGQDLKVTVDSSGLSVGQYSVEISLSSDPAVPGSPMTLPVYLTVVSELKPYYMPMVLK